MKIGICINCGKEYQGKIIRKFCSKECNNYFQGSDTARRMFIRIKSKCKIEGINFNLEPDDVVIPDVCPVLGIEVKPNRGGKGYHPNSPSLDRIKPDGGYVKGNVRVISARANLLKNDAKLWELEAVLKDAKSFA